MSVITLFKVHYFFIGHICWGGSSGLWWTKKGIFSFVGVGSCRITLCWCKHIQILLYECNSSSGKLIYIFSRLFYYFIFPIILQNNHYKYLGQYVVMSMTQGGCGIPYLSPPVYDYICSGKLPSSIEVDKKNLPNTTLAFILQKVGLFGCT